MAKFIKLPPTKTYASEANAIAAVEKKFSGPRYDNLTFIVTQSDDGRYFPVFTGGEKALAEMVHFHFHVVG